MPIRVPAYHSIAPNDPKRHHVFSDCTEGNNIEPRNKRPGTNGYPMCDHCRRMGG
jgi:hypothetical protein